ncbi:MAG: aminotransferase class I/II-fold pyridoxal phosphate-dependent enzyme [Acidimicrobiales bacterium]|jgi:dTDP-4-amino-4,6-dideoxygalactose transaminase|nr:aminotransferase class I/II-fold pyridoxal phosphate-dependent enzyme [Acidimicrobiales bacterium]
MTTTPERPAPATVPDGPIPFFRPQLPPLEDYVAELERIWSTKMLSNFADYSRRLEALATGYLGANHVLTVVSGDIGLVLALRALEIPRGAPAFVSTFTFNSTINAALWAGLRPVLVDIDPATFCLSADALSEAVQRHPEPGVVLATHTFGNPCDHAALRSVADASGSRLVYDAAHAYGSLRDGVHAGALGDAEVFSLSGTKLVTSAEGGLVSTPHDEVADRFRYLRGYGFQNDYNSRYVGLNGKISELHCALGVLTLAGVEQAVARRHEILAGYRSVLGDRVGWQAVRADDRSTYKDISLVLGDRRDAVESALAAAGVATKRYFLPLHHQDAYQRWAGDPLPAADEVYRTTLCVPAYNDLTDEQVLAIADVVAAALDAD